MKVTTESQDRLVLSANRRLAGVANIVAAPFVVWLGMLIVGEGSAAWFGWCFAALGPIMVIAGIWALVIRLVLVLDRKRDMIRFTLHGMFRRRSDVMKLSDLDHVTVRTISVNRHEHSVLDLVPKPESKAKTMTIREFWTGRAADDAAWAIRGWLG